MILPRREAKTVRPHHPGEEGKLLIICISHMDNTYNGLLFGLPSQQIQRLQLIQNSAARLVTRTKKYDSICIGYLFSPVLILRYIYLLICVFISLVHHIFSNC